jgi:hypothetical protein
MENVNKKRKALEVSELEEPEYNFDRNVKNLDSGDTVITPLVLKKQKPTVILHFCKGIKVQHHLKHIKMCGCKLLNTKIELWDGLGVLKICLRNLDHQVWLDAFKFLMLQWMGTRPWMPVEETLLLGAVNLQHLIGLAQPLCSLLNFLDNEKVLKYLDNAVVKAFHKEFHLKKKQNGWSVPHMSCMKWLPMAS